MCFLKTALFSALDMAGSKTLFLCQKLLVCLIQAVSVYLRPIFSFISFRIFRLKGDGSGSSDKVDMRTNFLETEPMFSQERKADKDITVFRDFSNDPEEEEREEEVYLKFKFPTFEEFSQTRKKTNGEIFNSEAVAPSVSTSKYEFSSGKSSISAFFDVSAELETFHVKEINADKDGSFLQKEEVFSALKETGEISEKGKEILAFDGEENEKSGKIGEFIEKLEEVKEQRADEEKGFLHESHFLSEKMISAVTESDTESNSESTSFEHIHSSMSRLVDSYSDGFLSDRNFGEELDIDCDHENIETESDLSAFEENDEFDDEVSDIMEEVHNVQKPEGLKTDFLSDKDFHDHSDSLNDGEKGVMDGDDIENCDDANKLEELWEHQELIEQLQMELKKVKASGLPTILEESESPKIMEDLKPWKIDEFQREDCIGELHKFYKSYRERMRKFDIVNYQKMYAMGFLQLKDPLHSASKQKASPPTLKSLVSQNLWLFKHKIHGSDPLKKLINELEGDLEAVYVGQMCLSWEFLHWQYDKALDLWDSDPRGTRSYNEVAGEFQQFQVLMQRFIEDEPFQGPRMQNYVKSRFLGRNLLLQVPVIREDKLKDKRKSRKTDEYAITSDMLVEIVEESIRILWRFVRADKDCTPATLNTNKKMPQLPTSEDLKLLVELRKDLQKKDKKLKDLLRSGNCILKKFRRGRDDETDQVLYFFSQVDMKLVARVLNMSRITKDQLIWCHNKLSRISFVNRKINVEPSFLLFPC